MRIFGEMAQSAKEAVASLSANRSRGVLTTLGIIIGIVGVVTTMTAANGISNNFKESVSALGSDVLYVSRMPWVMRGNFFQFRNRPNITLKDAAKLDDLLADAVAINPTISTNRSLKFQSATVREADVIGTTDKHLMVSASVPDLGRFLTAFDVQTRRRVAVIGFGLKESLFGDADPINQNLRIGRWPYRVIGVMEKQGSAGFFGGPNFDTQVFIPITTFINNFGGSHRDFNIAIKAPSSVADQLDQFEYAVTGEMRKLRKLKPAEADNFSVNKMDALVGMFNQVMGVVVLVGMVITGISLFVGGIGVMNIMFVSVTERTREIGVRKALGARRRTILAQFLIESSTIGLIGGAVGLAAAFGVTEIVDRMVLPASISVGIAVVAILVSVLVGIAAGLVPAWRASRLPPVMALRYE